MLFFLEEQDLQPSKERGVYHGLFLARSATGQQRLPNPMAITEESHRGSLYSHGCSPHTGS